MAKLEQALAALGVQQLSITSEPPGATLRVDGDLVGVTPWAGELAPGPHRVRLEHGGHEPREAELTLAAEHAGDLHVSLPALAVASVEQPSAWTRIQPLTWGMLGVGAGALVGGLAFELSRASSSERARAEGVLCRPSLGGTSGAAPGWPAPSSRSTSSSGLVTASSGIGGVGHGASRVP